MALEDRGWFRAFGERIKVGEGRRPEFGPIWLDIRSSTIRMAGTEEVQHLTPYEYQILWSLIRAQGNPVPAEEIENFIYEDLPDDKDIPITNAFDVHLVPLRKKLESFTHGRVRIKLSRKGEHAYTLVLNP